MRAYGWAVAVVAAAAVAALLVVVMAPPADQLIEPAPARASDYFSAAQIERGRDFRRPQVYIGLAALATQIALLAYLVRRPPERLRRAGARWWHGALAGAAIAVAQSAVVLPFTIVNRIRAIDVGLNTRSWLGWAWDWVLSVSINAVEMGLLAVALLWLMRRLPRFWWAPGTVVVIVVAVGWTLFSPVVLDPLFNRFEPLRAEPLRSQVLQLAREAGVDASEVQMMDASRRTTGANAYVAGLGHTKRIVLYDNLLQGLHARRAAQHRRPRTRPPALRRRPPRAALRRDRGAVRDARRGADHAPADAREPAPVVLPALALSILLITTGISWISNSLSRQVEARADAYALRTTNEPDALIALQRRLVIRNVSDPDPPDWVTAVFGTHPPPLDRIGSRVSLAAARASTSCGLLR